MIKITRRSSLTGIIHTREMDVTEDQLRSYYVDGHMVQDVFPHLSADDREFLISGATPEEWEAAFPEVEDEDYVPDPGVHDGQPDEAQEWESFDPDC